MLAPDDAFSAFIAGLKVELGRIQAFLDVLKSEEQALIRGDIERLASIAEDKIRLARELGKYAAERSGYLAAHGFSPDAHGMSACATGNAEATALWNRLLELAKQTYQINQTNGVLVNTRLQRNQQALAVLQRAFNSASLYGPDGQPQDAAGSRSLDIA